MSNIFSSKPHKRVEESLPPLSTTIQHLRDEIPSWDAIKTFFAERSLSKNANVNAKKFKPRSRSHQRSHGGKRSSKFRDSGHPEYPVQIYGTLPPDGIPRPPSFIHDNPANPSHLPQPDDFFYDPDPFAATPMSISFDKSCQTPLPPFHHDILGPTSLRKHSTAFPIPPPLPDPHSPNCLTQDSCSCEDSRSTTHLTVFSDITGSQLNTATDDHVLKHSHNLHDSGVYLLEAYTPSGPHSPKHRLTPLDVSQTTPCSSQPIAHHSIDEETKPRSSQAQPHAALNKEPRKPILPSSNRSNNPIHAEIHQLETKLEMDTVQTAPPDILDFGTRTAYTPINTRRPLKSSGSSPHLMFYSHPTRSSQVVKPSLNYSDTVVYFRSRDPRCYSEPIYNSSSSHES